MLKARQAIASATTVEQLRQAQAVVLPLDYALSLADHRRVTWMGLSTAPSLYGRQVAGAADAPKAGGRKRQNMTRQEESEFLAPFLASAAVGGILMVSEKSRLR